MNGVILTSTRLENLVIETLIKYVKSGSIYIGISAAVMILKRKNI